MAKTKGSQEIERRFLLEELPTLPILKTAKMLNYKTIYVYTDDPELRLRRVFQPAKPELGFRFSMTIKFGEGIERGEYPTPIGKKLFKEGTEKYPHQVEKIRYKRANESDGLLWEIDHFTHLKGLAVPRRKSLFLAEIELDGPNQMFNIPGWLKIRKEVTNDLRYSNKNIAVYGIPVED